MEVTAFNVVEASAAYAELAGIIAGFAFAVLVWLMDRLAGGDDDRSGLETFTERATIILALTFLTNILAAIFFALLTGEVEVTANRPAILAFIATAMFTLVAPLTMEAMVFVVASAGGWRIMDMIRRIFYASILVGFLFQWLSTLGLLQTIAHSRDLTKGVLSSFITVFVISLILLVVGFVIGGRPNTERFGLDSIHGFNTFVSIWLIFVLVAVVLFLFESSQPPDLYISSGAVAIANVLWVVVVTWAMAFLPVLKEGGGFSS